MSSKDYKKVVGEIEKSFPPKFGWLGDCIYDSTKDGIIKLSELILSLEERVQILEAKNKSKK